MRKKVSEKNFLIGLLILLGVIYVTVLRLILALSFFTYKFLNKTALEIYRDKEFEITKEEDNENGEVELTLQLKDQEKNYPYVVTCEGSKFVDNKFSILMNNVLEEFLKNISLNRCLQYATKKKN